MVLRGGFGIAYNRVPVILFANSRGNPPFFARYRICCGTSAQDFSTPFNSGQILYALGANNSPFSYPGQPRAHLDFNPATGIPTLANGGAVGDLRRAGRRADALRLHLLARKPIQLPGSFTAEVGYQGSAAPQARSPRQPDASSSRRPGQSSRGVFFPTPDTTASYNAMIARLTRRFSRGFKFDAQLPLGQEHRHHLLRRPRLGHQPDLPARRAAGARPFRLRRAAQLRRLGRLGLALPSQPARRRVGASSAAGR